MKMLDKVKDIVRASTGCEADVIEHLGSVFIMAVVVDGKVHIQHRYDIILPDTYEVAELQEFFVGLAEDMPAYERMLYTPNGTRRENVSTMMLLQNGGKVDIGLALQLNAATRDGGAPWVLTKEENTGQELRMQYAGRITYEGKQFMLFVGEKYSMAINLWEIPVELEIEIVADPEDSE